MAAFKEEQDERPSMMAVGQARASKEIDAMAATWLEEPQSGVNYKLAGEELVDTVRKIIRDDDWQFTSLGGTIILRRDPTRIRAEIERSRRIA